jgi:hypothetical protein
MAAIDVHDRVSGGALKRVRDAGVTQKSGGAWR